MNHPQENEVPESFRNTLKEQINKEHSDKTDAEKEQFYSAAIDYYIEGRDAGKMQAEAKIELITKIGEEVSKRFLAIYPSPELAERLKAVDFNIDLFKDMALPCMITMFLKGTRLENLLNDGMTQYTDLVENLTVKPSQK